MILGKSCYQNSVYYTFIGINLQIWEETWTRTRMTVEALAKLQASREEQQPGDLLE